MTPTPPTPTPRKRAEQTQRSCGQGQTPAVTPALPESLLRLYALAEIRAIGQGRLSENESLYLPLCRKLFPQEEW